MPQAMDIINQPGSQVLINNIPLEARQYRLPADCGNTAYQRFVGRKPALDKLLAALSSPQAQPLNCVIHGLNGVGKSKLACRIVNQLIAENKHLRFIWLSGETSIEEEFARFAESLGINVQELKFADIVQQTYAELVESSQTNGGAPLLFVLDNVKNQAQVEQITTQARSTAIQILITSTSRHWTADNFFSMALEVFNDQEASEFIGKALATDYQLAMEPIQRKADCQTLSALSGNLPLALEQMTSYLRMKQISVAEYQLRFQSMEKQLNERQLAKIALLNNEGATLQGLHRRTVLMTLLITLNAITKDNDIAVDLLKLCGFVASHDIPAKLLQAHLNPQTSLADIINLLQNYSVITEARPKLFEVHTLVQEVLRLIVDVNASKTYLGKLINYLHSSAQAKSSAQHYIEPNLVIKHSVVVSQRAIDYQLYQDALYDFANTVFEESYLNQISYGYDKNIHEILQNLIQHFNKDGINSIQQYFGPILQTMQTNIEEAKLLSVQRQQNRIKHERYRKLLNNSSDIGKRMRNFDLQAQHSQDSINSLLSYAGIDKRFEVARDLMTPRLDNSNTNSLQFTFNHLLSLKDMVGDLLLALNNAKPKPDNTQRFNELTNMGYEETRLEKACNYVALNKAYTHKLEYLNNFEYVLIAEKEKYISILQNAHGQLAHALANLGYFVEALNHIDTAIQLAVIIYPFEGHDERASHLYTKMKILLECGKVPEARELLEELQRIHVRHGREPAIPNQLLQLKCYLELADYHNAKSILQAINNAFQSSNLDAFSKINLQTRFLARKLEFILVYEPSIAYLFANLVMLLNHYSNNSNLIAKIYRCGLHIVEYETKLFLSVRGKLENADYKDLENLVNNKDLFQSYEADTARAHWLLAKFYLLDYSLAEAEQQLALALSIQTLRYEKHHNVDLDYPHPDLAKTYRELAVIHLINQEYADAYNLSQDALKLFKRCYETDNHPEIAYTLQVRGDLYFSQRNYAQAAENYLQSFHILNNTVAKTHPAISEAFLNYTNAFSLQLRHVSNKASSLQQYLALAKQHEGMQHPLISKLKWQAELVKLNIGSTSATLFHQKRLVTSDMPESSLPLDIGLRLR